MKINKLHHIAIICSDYQRSLRFYTGVLGFEVLAENGIFDKLRDRHQTAYIAINPHNCVACWDCFNACPKHVFGKVDILGHRHIKIKRTTNCIGCGKCVRVCQHDAIIILKP